MMYILLRMMLLLEYGCVMTEVSYSGFRFGRIGVVK